MRPPLRSFEQHGLCATLIALKTAWIDRRNPLATMPGMPAAGNDGNPHRSECCNRIPPVGNRHRNCQ